MDISPPASMRMGSITLSMPLAPSSTSGAKGEERTPSSTTSEPCYRRNASCPGGGLGPMSCGRRCTRGGRIVVHHLGRWINYPHLGPLRLVLSRLRPLPIPNPLVLSQRVITTCLCFPGTVLDPCRCHHLW
jgi:hypothetical protein